MTATQKFPRVSSASQARPSGALGRVAGAAEAGALC